MANDHFDTVTAHAAAPLNIQAYLGGNIDTWRPSALMALEPWRTTSSQLRIEGPNGARLEISGSGLTYDDDGKLTGGTVSRFSYQDGWHSVSLTVNADATEVRAWFESDAVQQLFVTSFQGNDTVSGGSRYDLFRGHAGDDLIYGGGGNDSLYGGSGNDEIYTLVPSYISTGAMGQGFLRGEAGNDTLVGSDYFDDMHGNMGNDSLVGGKGGDWVVGGQDNDSLYGEAGNDIVYGNLGVDWCYGGDGDDFVRGGQGDDVIHGGAGNDWLTGDRGEDLISGGAGADQFHIFAGAGLEQVSDFSYAAGDRVNLLPGQAYTVSQVGGDTVIDLGGGDRMVLVGVTSLPPGTGWIVFG